MPGEVGLGVCDAQELLRQSNRRPLAARLHRKGHHLNVGNDIDKRSIDPAEWAAWFLRLEKLYNVRLSGNL